MNENDNPVFDLSNQSEPRIVAAQTPVNPVVYRENQSITSQTQPYPNNLNLRIPLPITTRQNAFSIPRNGLDVLHGLPSVHIYQTYELNELLSNVSSENRFTIRGPSTEALFGASESSNPGDRIYGSSRPFSLSLIDKSHQEAILFKKNFGCGLYCCICKNQIIEAWAPPGDLLGCIQQQYTLIKREFKLIGPDQNVLYRIVIPFSQTVCMPKEAHFKVMSEDYLTQKGSITRIWNTDISCYTINVYFIDRDLNSRNKALFLGAAFMLEYIYFQSACC